MSEAAAAGERGGARAAQSGQRLTGDGRDGVGRDIDEGSVDLYSGKRCGWRISQGCDSAHPFLSGKDPQTISGIDATYGGDSGFFGTGSNNEWKADGHWSITPFTLQDFQKTRRDASALESGSDGSETRAGEWNRPESPIPRTPTRRSNPRGKSQSSEMFVSAGDHRVGSSGSRRNSASPKGAFSFSKYGMRSTAAQIYASTGAIRTRRVPASLANWPSDGAATASAAVKLLLRTPLRNEEMCEAQCSSACNPHVSGEHCLEDCKHGCATEMEV